jgi:hypothetical protein
MTGDPKALTQQFAALLRIEFASEIEKDPRRFKRLVLGLLKAELPPRPGRPPSEAVTRAIEMLEQGKSWRKIYSKCLPPTSSQDSRQLSQYRLRCAVRSRRSGRRRRKSPSHSSTK